MKDDVPELTFPSRADFRTWLIKNSETSGGVWLVFGKTKDIITLSSNDALEEALCFGWIDGQLRSVDETRYLKYFARRRPKSMWSDKNKGIVDVLRERGIMTELGENAVENAKNNGMWDMPKDDPITDDDIEAFTEMLAGITPAYENFSRMPPSVRRTYTRRFLSNKSDDARKRDFEKITDRLNKDLRPM
jgi:uncharacterized protein YdeI (YjbR/CyaY-like superfamily)